MSHHRIKSPSIVYDIDKIVDHKGKPGPYKYLVKWNTGKQIAEQLNNFKFLENYEIFNKEIFDIYQELKLYARSNYKNVEEYINKYTSGEEFMKSTVEYCNKVNEMQLFIRDHKEDSEAIKLKSTELFGLDTVESSIGLDLEVHDKLQILVNYVEPVKDLFNELNCLTKITTIISYNTESMIKEVIINKGLDKYKVSKEIEELV